MSRVFLKRYRNLLEISRDGREPLSDQEYGLLVPQMEYQQLITLHGRAAYGPDGDYNPIQTVKKRLYWWDDRGRLVCGKGFIDRVGSTFQAMGYTIDYQDKSPPPYRPQALVPVWENLAEERFRPLQEPCLRAIADRVAQGRGGIIKAIPGFGKSHLLRALCLLYPRARIGITIPDIDNTNKTYRHIVESLPSVGQIGAGQRSLRRVTICTQLSLGHLRRNVDTDKDLDLLFVDECHKYAAEATSEHLGALTRNAIAFGLSATPTGRLDRQDAKLEPLFGPIIYEISWEQGISHGLVVPITAVWHDVFLPENPCRDGERPLRGVSRKRHGVWRNNGRNRVIAQVAQSYPAGEQVLVMCQFVEHALFLKKYLPDFELVYAARNQERLDDIADLQGLTRSLAKQDYRPEAMTWERRENMRIGFERGTLKKVIANDVWSTGVSFNSLQILVRADARTNEILDEQIPGRVSRIHPESGKSTGFLVDFLDQFDRGMQRAAQERRANYRAKGWHEIMPAKVGLLDGRRKGGST